ncbi:MAG: extracellular solute-binding protein [Pseudomonadota bacterium]
MRNPYIKHMAKSPISRRGFLAGTGAVAAGLSFTGNWAAAAEEAKLNFYNWDTYIGEDTLSDFKSAMGIDVTMDLFADNEELFAKLRHGNPGYDVIVPTNDYVERMIAANMLMALDYSRIPNYASNVEPAFQRADFDPGRKFSAPYMWGTMGIGYRKSKVKTRPDSWEWLLDSNAYKGRCAILSEPQAVLGTTMVYLGYDFNSTDPAHMRAASDLLIKQKPNWVTIAEDNGQDLLLSGECDLVMEWNGDILQVMAEDDDLDYLVPNEGGLVWQDCLCIPNGAPHPQKGL